MDCVVSPVDHKLSVASEEVSTTLPPSQKPVGPLAVITGADAIAFAVTTTGDEAGDVHPLGSV